MLSIVAARPSTRAPQTELGLALRIAWWSYSRRIDVEMEAAGFPDLQFPMIYVFALYSQPEPMTISQMGRQFSVSRQAASKVVADLRRRGYVHVTPSTTDQREKVVELAPKAIEYVSARLRKAAALDRAIRKRLGDDGRDELIRLLGELGAVARSKLDFDPGMFPVKEPGWY
ncbi:transcriptional regulator [Mycobacterium persicum]|uniref:Transcriptional regulator n=1 Tax=Mycobacterium persicum TaxID=1487726 RepID=A0A1X0L7S2_9MYCO|nr:transcriptional regulator [Mycobacterium persicum]ORB42342.1 transcriptional regulator [Mycobacterium persicum]ORB89569.1 transcriptional regulator [Mycobacterium persicum]ORB95012.1 transcriptional regulator [Mycobacterium persicum]ORC01760.1 transcriptional regulator [Mycobacterium persicum]